MSEQVFGDFKGLQTKMFGSSREFSKLTLGKLEQLIMLQLATMREYAELNLEQLKAAAEIAGPEDLTNYLGKQQDYLKAMAEKMAGNSQAMAAIGNEFAEEAKNIAMQGFANGTTKQH